jgi:regulator of sirC expression with transglutaminase-like and TPR domain
MGNTRAARENLERYLELAPEAADREQVAQQIQGMRKVQARLN